ncbi:MAG: alpha-amylase family glycosyl hydrolase [Ginsengibacter sp.]
MKSVSFVVILIFFFLQGHSQTTNTSPPYIKDLVIYEIAPKGFTSPAGPESGTFKSTAEKMPYLKKLGINSIWLTGHNWADANHFYGIWTQYATIRPDSIDPTLGTPKDFKLLVETAHRNGIKVFLDVITHGVMSYSPLIKQHPNWFKGGSWGMTDYDWKGNHKDLDDWWVKTWTDYVFNYGIDGFRLDVSIFRADLWKRIKELAAKRGHSIVVFNETREPFTEGAFDFYQRYAMIQNQVRPNIYTAPLFLNNVARYFNTDTVRQNYYYSIQLSCHDNGWMKFPAGVNPYVTEGSRCLFGYSTLFTPAIPIFMSGEEFNADFKPLPRLSPDLFGKTPPGDSSRWLYGSWIQWNQLQEPDKKAMWNDVQHMLSIRTREKSIIHVIMPGDKVKRILPVEGNYDEGIPVPYLLWNKNTAILVAGNPGIDKDIELTLNIPLAKAGLLQSKFRVTDLWNDGKPVVMTKTALQQFVIKIKKDKQPKGGLAVYKIEGI